MATNPICPCVVHAVFFVNVGMRQKAPFVYEELPDGSLQIYTTKCPEEFNDDLQKIFGEENWFCFKSIEVNTVNVSDEQDVESIKEEFPELQVAKGFYSS